MAIRISKRDLETLSSYLDGQLTPRERAQLETRLQTELELRTALEQIWQTQAAVRTLPFLRAPRNYTLTPRMVGARKQSPRLYPTLGLASALASFIFILVLIGDLISIRTPAITSLQAVQLSETPVAELMAPVQTEAALSKSAAPEGETGVARESTTATEEPVLTSEATVVAEMMAPAPQEPEAAIESLEAGAADQASEPRLQAKASASITGGEPMTESKPTRRNTLRILEVTLLIVAFSTGVAALYLRSRPRKSLFVR